MKINSIIGFHTQDIQDRKNKTYKNISFMNTPPVPKTLEYFGTRWYKKLPVTFRNFFDNLKDKSVYSPLQAFAMAFSGLFLAKSIQDVQNAFPQECEEGGFFAKLRDYRETKATDGLLSIYRQNKESYPNGILKNGENITVYLLKKLFLEGKTREQVNQDLENDLLDDIKSEFKRKYPDRKYIGYGSYKKSYGIKFLDSDCFTSFIQTNEEYNKWFRECCVQAQQKRYSLEKTTQDQDNEPVQKTKKKINRTLTPEQREEIGKRNKERWDALTPEQQATTIKLLNDGYREYWKKLSKEEQAKVIQRLIDGWKILTPKQKTAAINKMKCANERQRYAMYDAWNNSIDLILELSEFLKSKHELRLSDIDSTEEFSDFQSEIMTEFWATHTDLADEFGLQISIARERINIAIKDGNFEELKKLIESERDIRNQLIEEEKQIISEEKAKNKDLTETKDIVEPKEINKSEVEKTKPNTDEYKKEFQKAYITYLNRYYVLPFEYVDDIVNIIVSGLPQETVENMTKTIKNGSEVEDVSKIFKDRGDIENYEKVIRYQRALEGTMSYMLNMRLLTRDPKVFSMDMDTLLNIYACKINDLTFTRDTHIKYSKEKYKEFKQNLSEKELNNIVNQYFLYQSSEDAKIIADYIKTYGRSITLLFSDKTELDDNARMDFHNKFMKMMPDEVKNICIPVIKNQTDLTAEKIIKQISQNIKKRYEFMPKDFLEAYTNEVINTIHVSSHIGDKHAKETYSIKSFMDNVCDRKSTTIGSEEYKNYSYLMIPKIPILRENKIKIMAAEQALADALFDVTGDEKIYEVELEELMSIFEIFITKDIDRIVFDDKGNKRFEAKESPKTYDMKKYYMNHVKELSENSNKIFNGDDIKDAKELLYTLNPDSEKEYLDKYIEKRLKIYYDKSNWQSILPFHKSNN